MGGAGGDPPLSLAICSELAFQSIFHVSEHSQRVVRCPMVGTLSERWGEGFEVGAPSTVHC